MSDLISRQAAIDALEFGITYARAINKETGEVKELFQESNDELRKAVERVKELPSVQSEIIRCKDCKHWGIHKWLNIPWCREMHIDRGAEDFCSNAERRTDG